MYCAFAPTFNKPNRSLQAAGADLKAARKALFPSLVINSQLGWQAFNAAFLFNTPASLTYNLFGGLTAPLLNRRRLKSMVMRSAAEQRRAVVNYEKTLSNAFREVITAIQKLENMRLAFDRKNREADCS
jgi:outer membrane protein, multidrug efflux system